MEPRAPRPVPRGRVGRVVPFAGPVARSAGEAVIASLRKDRGGARSGEFHRRNAERYAQRMGNSRGLLMKAGQILSMVIPEGGVEGADCRGVYRRAFAKLFDAAPPMPTAVAVATVEAELGASIGELFEHFDAVPVAAASIGQVHRARLRDGRDVVVKVQYPGVEEAIQADLANTELLGTFLQLLLTLVPNLSGMDARAMTREISDRIGEEIDYLTEAANQREFAAAYAGHPFIRIPAVHEELTTRRVLTMAFDDGIRYRDARHAPQELRDRWGEAIYRFVWEGVARLGLSNSDPHPGNFLFHPDGSVTFLDFGCVKRLEPSQVQVYLGLFRHLLDRDPEALYDWMIRCEYLRPDVPVDPQQLLAMLTASYFYLEPPQPFTFTPDVVSFLFREAYHGPGKDLMRRMSAPAWQTMLVRMGAGSFSVLGGLGATGHWRAILEESWFAGPTATDYGVASSHFWAAGA